MLNTTLCYIERDGRYLMLHRVKKDSDPNRGKWIGVGGKFEEGESPEECAVREVREETGLTLESLDYRGVVTFVSDVWPAERMHLFTSDRFTGELKECAEGDLKWVQKDALPGLPLWEGDKVFLRLLSEGASFFELTLRYMGEALVSAELGGQTAPDAPPKL